VNETREQNDQREQLMAELYQLAIRLAREPGDSPESAVILARCAEIRRLFEKRRSASASGG